MNLADLDLTDVKPIPQDDGPEPVCSIAYSPEFIQAYDYLRALLKADERSVRAFNLTSLCLKLNPSNYTVWHFRRRCLISLSSKSGQTPTIDVDRIHKDLDFADKLGGTNPKNYQLWYHRRALLEFQFKGEGDVLRMAKKELEYVDRILDDDSKNYHAWSHRQWIVKALNEPELWSSEVEYSHSKILSDPRNNSAWNQRWFALHVGNISSSYKEGRGSALSLEKAHEEASYAVNGADVDPFNESPWRYLIGVLMEQWRLAKRGGRAGEISKATILIQENICKMREMKKSWGEQPPTDDHPPGPAASLLSALVDLLEIFTEDEKLLMEAKSLLEELMLEDPIRRKYWLKRERGISKLLISIEQRKGDMASV